MNAPIVDLSFARCWHAEILSGRPLILPSRHFTYPREAEEVERGALEVLIRPDPDRAGPENELPQPFLATCALGFRDPAVPTGLYSAPKPGEICAVSGGYAYVIDTTAPERFTMIPYRPVVEVRPLPAHGLLLFVGHRSVLAWGNNGQAWESGKLSDEGITLIEVRGGTLHGRGWTMMTDKETDFAIELKSGRHTD
jgi:hypothetical protein